MVTFTFYGGINEIGGNKILLEDGDHRLLLDFGFPYKRHKEFYEEYLKPRSGAGLLDPLAMELLPPLEGLYRSDLETPDLWLQFRERPLYRRLTHVDGVLLSHAHLDHSGHISFLREDIPVYSTATTAFISKAMQDSGKSDFDQQVCYFNPVVQDCPAGWKQMACLTGSGSKKQRQFCVADIGPEVISPDALQFWADGFWEKTARQKKVDSSPLAAHTGCAFPVRCFPVDHSIPGACAWGIETGSGWVVYSGDLRLHGKRAELTRKFLHQAASLHPAALIIEGTNVLRPKNVAEQEVHENALKATRSSIGLVIADFSARDVDRLLTFWEIAKETGRKLVILPKDAYLLKTVRLLDAGIPDLGTDPALAIYQDTTANKSPVMWLRNIYAEYESKIVLANDINADQGHFILCFSFFDMNEMPSIRPLPGSLYVYSSSEPHDEEQEIDFKRLHKWLEHFRMTGFGLPREHNGEWQVPDGEKGLHASGHACGPDLLQIVREIHPKVLIPVHTQHSEVYVDQLGGSGIDIKVPSLGTTITL